MIQLNYPEPSFRIKRLEGKDWIFDAVRKKWVIITQEEWVRQNFIQYLVQILGYPASSFAVEKEIRLGELKKRFDILVYDQNHKPWMLIECKASEEILNEKVLQQVLRYNVSVPVAYVIITNGNHCFGWENVQTELKVLEKLPKWKK